MSDLHQQLAGGRWIIAELTGHPGDRPDLHPDPDDLVVAIGAGLQALHSIPVPTLLAEIGSGQDAPGHGWNAIVARCREAVDAGRVDARSLPQPYCRYRAGELLEMLIEGRPEQAHDAEDQDDQDLVCCHGSATAGRFMVNGGRFTGFQGLETALIADRHLDLAVIHQSVQQVFGPEAVFRLYEVYGRDPDLARLEHYVLASHLMPTIWTGIPEPGLRE